MDNAKTVGSSLLVGLIIGAISGYYIGKPSPPAQVTPEPAIGVEMLGTILEMGGDTAPVCGVAMLELDSFGTKTDKLGHFVANARYTPGKSMFYSFPTVPDSTEISITAQYALAPPIPKAGAIPAVPGDSTTGIVVMNYVTGDTFVDTIPSAYAGDDTDSLTLDADVIAPSDLISAMPTPTAKMAIKATSGAAIAGEATIQIKESGSTAPWNYTTSQHHAHVSNFAGKKGKVYTVTVTSPTALGLEARPLHFQLYKQMQRRTHIHLIIREREKKKP